MKKFTVSYLYSESLQSLVLESEETSFVLHTDKVDKHFGISCF